MLRREGVTVVEVNRPDRADRRRRGKSAATDAEAAKFGAAWERLGEQLNATLHPPAPKGNR